MLLLALLAAAIVYNLVVIWAAESYRGEPAPSSASAFDSPGVSAAATLPGFSIFKPLRGAEPRLYDCLASFCRLDYPTYELLFCAASEDDAGLEIARRLQRDFPAVPMKVLVADHSYGANRKVDNLDKMYREMRHQILVISDDDMIVPPEYLRRLRAELQQPGVGVVTCAYRGRPGETFASQMEALGIAGEFFGGALVARRMEGVRFAMGSTIAVRKELVAEIGGFPALADYLADDYELGARLAARGYRNVISAMVVDTQLPPDTWRSMLAHQFRWMRAQAISRPGGHIGLGVTYGSVCSLAVLAWYPQWWPWVVAWAVARCAACWWVGARTLDDPVVRRWWWLAPLRELLTASLWFASLFRRTVVWRGERFRTEGGKMVRV
jgi:ceramide glucosyltransferase